MNATAGLPSALREFADDLNGAAARLAKVLTSIAGALESRTAEDVASTPVATTRAASRRPRATSKRAGAGAPRAPRPVPAATAPPTSRRRSGAATTELVRAAIADVGPATAAQIAEHINNSAGRRVVDGRAIRGFAESAGARVVSRDGQRMYTL